jgi:hypothetical protein
MSEEHTPGLPDDWKPPERALLEQAWESHPRHEELVRLGKERDERGYPIWGTHYVPHPEHPDWMVIWFRPVDPRDKREGIQLKEYPIKAIEDEYARVRAVIDEHHLDD